MVLLGNGVNQISAEEEAKHLPVLGFFLLAKLELPSTTGFGLGTPESFLAHLADKSLPPFPTDPKH